MLYCGINEVSDAMVVAASVFHPRRPEVELLSCGVRLEPGLIARLRQIGVTSLWVEHDLTGDLDHLINPTPSKALRSAFQQLKHDFGEIGRQTVSAGHIFAYRQLMMELVCELVADRHLSGLTERLIGGPPSLFTHSANVAYLSICVALELEAYVVRQRRQMAVEHARDLTPLGIGAMLHDIGKLTLSPELQAIHATGAPDDLELDDGALASYREHPADGFRLLRETRAPASARQVVLNHHQRWDGRGFPDQAKASVTGRSGTLSGERIHIFSRIVAAADVLDNLLHPQGAPADAADGGSVVAALRRFASSEFDGWFDPVVRDAMLRRVPPFAVGSRVVLSDGRAAVVVAPSVEQPCRPSVRLLDAAATRSSTGIAGDTAARPPALDLRLHRGLHIVRCGGADVAQHLFELPERSPLALEAVTGRVA
jgi:hypothetical protein